MENKIAVIHTTPVTIASLKELIEDNIPNCEVINFLDDSILPYLLKNNDNMDGIKERLITFTKYAEESKADLTLFACSSVGEVVQEASKYVSMPVLRIDEAMAEKAVQQGLKLGVVATLPTTLNPTSRLIRQKAKESNKDVEIIEILEDKAYEQLKNGNREMHDSILAETLKKLVDQVDIVVLAQASMASAVAQFPEDQQQKFLTSPKLGIQRVKEVIEGMRK